MNSINNINNINNFNVTNRIINIGGTVTITPNPTVINSNNQWINRPTIPTYINCISCTIIIR